MQILLNDKYVGINYINLKRNQKIINDQLILRISNKFKMKILNQIEYQGRLSILVECNNKTNIHLYEVTFKTNYIYLVEEHNNTEEILLEVIMSNKAGTAKKTYNQFIVDIFIIGVKISK